MELDKLSPAPWHAADDSVWTKDEKLVFDCRSEDAEEYDCSHILDFDTCFENADFAVLARNAFDVMMRRGWMPIKIGCDKQWIVESSFDHAVRDENGEAIIADDPFTALVEADQWYKEHVEKESGHER